MKRIIPVLLSVMLLMLLLPSSSQAASAPSYSNISISSITSDNAVLTASINNPSKVRLTEGGFYIGSQASSIKNGIKKTDKISGGWQTAKLLPCSYDLKNEYSITLKANTTYYLMLYCKDNKGNYYYSSVQSFVTMKSVDYSSFTIQSISTDTAVATAIINNPSRIKLIKGGFGIGTQPGTCMMNGSSVDTITGSWQTAKTIPCSYNFKDEYGIALNANTTYYLQLYCTDNNGNNYYSEEVSFTTQASQTASSEITGNNTESTETSIETSIGPFISNLDESLPYGNGGVYDGCFLNSMTMVLNALGKRNAAGNYLTPYDVAEEETNSCPGFEFIEDKFNVSIIGSDQLMPDFKSLSSSDQETRLINLLQALPQGQRVLRVSFGFHCVAICLNSDNQLVVYDPGYRSRKQAEGTNNWFGEGVTYSETTARWGATAKSFILVEFK